MKEEISMRNDRVRKIIFIFIVLSINLIIFNVIHFERATSLKVSYELRTDKSDTYQVLYTQDEKFDGEKRVDINVESSNDFELLEFEIPKETKQVRLDFGAQAANIQIKNLSLVSENQVQVIQYMLTQEGHASNDLGEISKEDEIVQIILQGEDPYIILDISDINFHEESKDFRIKIAACGLVTILLLVIKKIYRVVIFLGEEMYHNRRLIWNLSKNDFKTKYAGSYLGIIWAFVQPIVTVLIYWFVFEVGFKSAPMDDFPFVLWLVAGIIPWFFFNESLLNATNSLLEYNYLVKKVVFKISILPIVKIMSSLYVHIFFIILANIIYIMNGYMPGVYMIQVIYYSLCTFILALGISYATSAMVIFFKDLGQIVNILLQFGMWMTPIMWSYEMISPQYQWILKLNPMYYVVEGYRDTFIRKVWFWERFNQTIYFWVVAVGLFIVGTVIFKKLKNHFADVL